MSYGCFCKISGQDTFGMDSQPNFFLKELGAIFLMGRWYSSIFKNIYLRKNQNVKRSSSQIDWASCPGAVGEEGASNRITWAIYPPKFSVVRDSLALRGFQCMHWNMTFWTWESRTALPLGNVSLALAVHSIHQNCPEFPQNSKR